MSEQNKKKQSMKQNVGKTMINYFFYVPFFSYFTKEGEHYFLHENGRKEEVVAVDTDVHYKGSVIIVTKQGIYGTSLSFIKRPFMTFKKDAVPAETMLKCCPVHNPLFHKWVTETVYMDAPTIKYFALLLSYDDNKLFIRKIDKNIYEIRHGNDRFYSVQGSTHVKIFDKSDLIDAAKLYKALDAYSRRYRNDINKSIRDMGSR